MEPWGCLCDFCIHIYPLKKNLSPSCEAFPKGIPDEIYLDCFDHRQPYPNDNGIRYQPAEGLDKVRKHPLLEE